MVRSALAVIVYIVVLKNSCQSYEIPEPDIIVYKQRGFSVSIPHVPGIRLFGFHANINKEISDLQIGDCSRDVTINANGKWTFYDRRTKLSIGDTIHYWLYVLKHGVEYKFHNGRFTVNELVLHPLIRNAAKASTYVRHIDDESCAVCEARLEQMKNIIEQGSNAKKLTMSGRIPLDGNALSTVSFLLREKLDINLAIVSAQRNSDGSITFEVGTINDKLDILAAAKQELSGTHISIQ